MQNMPTKCVISAFPPISEMLIADVQVIQKIGLCIGFYDLLESSDGLIGHGTGLVNVNGGFEYIHVTAGLVSYTDY